MMSKNPVSSKYILTIVFFVTGVVLSLIAQYFNSKGILGTVSESYTTSGVTYYVSPFPAGDDSNPGTSNSPFRTLTRCHNVATTGDTCIVTAGTYNERTSITRSGITFEAQGMVVTKGFSIIADDTIIRGFEIANTAYVNYWSYALSAGIYVKGASNRIENNYIHDASLMGIVIYGPPGDATVSHDNVLRNNWLYHNQDTGIFIAGRNNIVEHNEIWHTVQCHPTVLSIEGSCADKGMDANGMSFFGQGHTIRNNYIHDISMLSSENLAAPKNPHIDCFQTWTNAEYADAAVNVTFEANRCNLIENQRANDGGNGFMLQGASLITIRNNVVEARTGVNVSGGSNDQLTIVHNVFANSLAANTSYPEGVEMINTPNSVLRNNIFYNQRYATILFLGDPASVSMDYNLAWNADSSIPKCIQVSSGEYPCYSPVPANNKWGVDPLFVDADSSNYLLQLSSPAKNAGYGGVDIGLLSGLYAGTITPTPTPSVTATTSPTVTVSPTATISVTPTVLPTTLRNVYFTFGKLRYGRYAATTTLRSGDMIYLKNFDPKKLKLLSISLYDYVKNGNQCYVRTWRTSTSMYMRTCSLLPKNRKYTYIFKFQDKATGIITKKYFVIYTTKVWEGQSVQ